VSTDRAETGLGPKEAIMARQEMASRLSNFVTAMVDGGKSGQVKRNEQAG